MILLASHRQCEELNVSSGAFLQGHRGKHGHIGGERAEVCVLSSGRMTKGHFFFFSSFNLTLGSTFVISLM